MDHGDKANKGAQKHEWRGGNKPGFKGFAWPLLDPDHYGDQRHSEHQPAIGE